MDIEKEKQKRLLQAYELQLKSLFDMALTGEWWTEFSSLKEVKREIGEALSCIKNICDAIN